MMNNITLSATEIATYAAKGCDRALRLNLEKKNDTRAIAAFKRDRRDVFSPAWVQFNQARTERGLTFEHEVEEWLLEERPNVLRNPNGDFSAVTEVQVWLQSQFNLPEEFHICGGIRIAPIRPDILKVDPIHRRVTIKDIKCSLTRKHAHCIQLAVYGLALMHILNPIGWTVDPMAYILLPTSNEDNVKPFVKEQVPLAMYQKQLLSTDLSPVFDAEIENLPWQMDKVCTNCPHQQLCRSDPRPLEDLSDLPMLSKKARIPPHIGYEAELQASRTSADYGANVLIPGRRLPFVPYDAKYSLILQLCWDPRELEPVMFAWDAVGLEGRGWNGQNQVPSDEDLQGGEEGFIAWLYAIMHGFQSSMLLVLATNGSKSSLQRFLMNRTNNNDDRCQYLLCVLFPSLYDAPFVPVAGLDSTKSTAVNLVTLEYLVRSQMILPVRGNLLTLPMLLQYVAKLTRRESENCSQEHLWYILNNNPTKFDTQLKSSTRTLVKAFQNLITLLDKHRRLVHKASSVCTVPGPLQPTPLRELVHPLLHSSYQTLVDLASRRVSAPLQDLMQSRLLFAVTVLRKSDHQQSVYECKVTSPFPVCERDKDNKPNWYLVRTDQCKQKLSLFTDFAAFFSGKDKLACVTDVTFADNNNTVNLRATALSIDNIGHELCLFRRDSITFCLAKRRLSFVHSLEDDHFEQYGNHHYVPLLHRFRVRNPDPNPNPPNDLAPENTFSALSPSQLNAVNRMRARQFSVLEGPPGTGKTTTMVELIQHWLMIPGIRPRILVVANTHAAVDNLLGRLAQALANRALVGQVCKLGKRPCPSPLVPHKPIKSHENARIVLTNYRVLGGTVYGVMKLTDPLKGYMMHRRFSGIVIDEASQMPAFDGVICVEKLSQSGSLVAAGDSNQLPPILSSDYVRGRGARHPPIEEAMSTLDYFKKSQKVAHLFSGGTFHLIENFRMGQELTEKLYHWVYHEAGYESRTNPPAIQNARRGEPLPRFARLAVQDPAAEARKVEQIIRRLLPTDTSIFVITPHHIQRQAVRQAVHGLPHTNVRIDTVEKFQGDQCDVAILCYAFTENQIRDEADFVFDRNRFVVALSRAKRHCFLLVSRRVMNLSVTVHLSPEQSECARMIQEF